MQNQREANFCRMRDRDEKQTLIDRQLELRQELQAEFSIFKQRYQSEYLELKRNIAYDMDAGRTLTSQSTRAFSSIVEKVYAPEF